MSAGPLGHLHGNITDNTPIDQLECQPDVVILQGTTTQVAVIRTSTLADDSTKPMTGAAVLAPDGVRR